MSASDESERILARTEMDGQTFGIPIESARMSRFIWNTVEETGRDGTIPIHGDISGATFAEVVAGDSH